MEGLQGSVNLRRSMIIKEQNIESSEQSFPFNLDRSHKETNQTLKFGNENRCCR